LHPGTNTYKVNALENLNQGVYILVVCTGHEKKISKLLKI